MAVMREAGIDEDEVAEESASRHVSMRALVHARVRKGEITRREIARAKGYRQRERLSRRQLNDNDDAAPPTFPPYEYAHFNWFWRNDKITNATTA